MREPTTDTRWWKTGLLSYVVMIVVWGAVVAALRPTFGPGPLVCVERTGGFSCRPDPTVAWIPWFVPTIFAVAAPAAMIVARLALGQRRGRWAPWWGGVTGALVAVALPALMWT